ncbi:unnamed protein product [Microthlaspi erraticum]|uniref:Geranylgeranyl transferase type-2 subunit alpha n=1 Tax=Microthlaspi erraticum TaxID=1685480 RepID=A0A6D2IXE1_9BRAS|nr:unnamed protein product [Microthlaspi erraticum]
MPSSVTKALAGNFKSYGACYHQKWVLSKGHRHSSLEKELELLSKTQKLDRRNFHSWNYRRFVMEGVHYEEILQLYNDLMTLDPSHVQYYKDEHSVALLRKETSSNESLSRHLFRYRNMNNIACLSLSYFKLSRMASVEKLLFVQMLDLSHNELRTAEGLEAMQLLCCLNLSHNRIRSFSALGSLRHLKQLKVLDVSHNHMGGN